jgi:hypothetical protein
MRTVRAPRRLIALSAAIYSAVGFEQEASKSEIEPVTFPAEIHGLKLDSLLHLVRFLASTHPEFVGRNARNRFRSAQARSHGPVGLETGK